MPGTANNARGFTVIELMITVVVVAILAGVALPSFRAFMQRNAVSGATNELMADLQYARGVAVSDRTFVSLCRSELNEDHAGDGDTCSANTSSVGMDRGWVLYTAAAPGLARATTAGTLPPLRVTSPSGKVSVRLGTAGIISFNQRGELVASSELRIAVCAKSNGTGEGAGISTKKVPGKLLLVSTGGRVATRTLEADSAECAAPGS